MSPNALTISLVFAIALAPLQSCLAATLPAQLFSPLISSKIKSTASSYSGQYPQYTNHANPAKWVWFTADQWTSGFFPATLYELHTRQTLCPAYSDKVDWLSFGRTWSRGLVPLETTNHVQHDVGFVSYPFVEELKINPKNASAIAAVNKFAKFLAGRYNAKIGCTRSWDSANPDFEVIIDNMMNLEVLFVSAGLTGNNTLKNIAISHADKTRVNHFRPDGSTYHVVHYSTTTGKVTSRVTSQGYANWSTWTRGQGWAIYGFATMYKYTGYQRYLDTARLAAKLFISRLPSSGVVPWDFDAPKPASADTSAATLTSTALLLLSSIEKSVGNNSGAKTFSDAAIKILTSTTGLAWKPTWQSLLSNGTVNIPSGNSNTGIVYGDYYYIKAGNALLSQGLASCSALHQ